MSCPRKKAIKSDKAPAALGPYSIANCAGPFVFTAGQLGLDPKTGVLVEGGIEAETKQALENVKAILLASNSSLENVVKTTVFLRDIADFAKMNSIYGEYFTKEWPARSAVQVAALPKGAAVEIETIAMQNQEE
jgi:2-iminobutanoate/2-iminopropanoate deaminase